jgi:calcium/calmodulin-dependent protein kinase I
VVTHRNQRLTLLLTIITADITQVAVKCVRRRALPEHERKALNAEMDIMLRLSHPNILKLLDSFKDREHLYMVVELARGGELFDRIVQKVCFN